LKYIFPTHCAASTARNLATVKMHVREQKFVPSVVRLDMAETPCSNDEMPKLLGITCCL